MLVRWLLRRAQFLGNDAKPEDQQSRASDLQQEWEITKAPFYSEEIVWLYNECGLPSLIQGRLNDAVSLFDAALKAVERIAIDVYSEYATITFALDHRRSMPDATWGAKPEDVAEYIREQMSHCPGVSNNFDVAGMSHSEVIYFGVWDLLTAERKLDVKNIGIKSITGDLRGFAICPQDCPVDQTSIEASQKKDDPLMPKTLRLSPDLQDVGAYLQKNFNFFLNCLGLEHNGDHRHDEPRKSRIEPNVILCRMLDGDAIYGSRLGSKYAFPKRALPTPTPVNYFIIYNGRSPNQLGRMVRRHHLLGELRIAALIDAETISRLGRSIRILAGLVLQRVNDGTRHLTLSKREFTEVVRLYNADFHVWILINSLLVVGNTFADLAVHTLAARRG